MDKLSHFLIDFATNPGRQEAFATNPDMVMEAVGLSEAEQVLLKCGSRTQITAALADESFQFAYCIGDPNPDPWPDPDPPPPDDSDSAK